MPPTPATDVFVARQPIFDARQRVFAYELLFRSRPETHFSPAPGPDAPASHVISNGMFVGLGNLTDRKPAFINFSRQVLVGDLPFGLPPKQVVVAITEAVEPEEQVLAACRKLKAAGYRLALDHSVEGPSRQPLVDLADFLKVDISAVGSAESASIAQKYRDSRHRTVARRVDTREAMAEAAAQGFQLFQGYFFSRPAATAAPKSIPGFRLNYLRLLQELNRPEVDIRRLEQVIKQEASITFRLLRRVNSAAYGFRLETSALRHALVLLGEREIRLCATVWALADLARDLPSELVVASTLRARLCELLAAGAQLADRSMDLFLLGMFSMLDAILEQPIAQIVPTLPLAADVCEALLGQPNRLRALLDCVTAYERGLWDQVHGLAERAGVPEHLIPTNYLEAVEWTQEIFQSAA